MPLLKQGHQKLVAQDHVHINMPKTEDTRIFLGNLFQCSVTLTEKKVFPDFQMEPPVFNFMYIAPCLLTRHQ